MPRKRHTKRRGGGTTREPAQPEEAKTKVESLPVEVAKEEEVKQEGDGYDDYLEEGAETYLPWEVWVVVLDFVSLADLARFSMTCRLFNAIADMGVVWRERVERLCWRQMAKWGQYLPDESQMGWKNACKAYTRLHWAELNVATFNRHAKFSMFEVSKPFECLAVDEESFAHAPDLVALGNFGCRSLDCVQLWRKDSVTSKWTLGGGIQGHTNTVSCIKFMDGTNRLITGSWDRTVKIWDHVNHETKQAKCVATLSGHEFEVKCIARHGSMLASGAEDKTLALWDMATGKRVHSFAGHTHFVESVLFAQEGQLLMSASPDKTIRVWDPRASADPVSVHTTGVPLRAIALSPDGNRIFHAPFNLRQRKSCWIDARAAEPSSDLHHSRWHSLSLQNAATAEHLAILPYRLSDGRDHLLANGTITSVPLAATGMSQTNTQELGYYSDGRRVRLTGSKGVCWTNSQVIVTGGDKKVYLADPTTKQVVPDPLADERGKQEVLAKLRALAETQRERRKQALSRIPLAPSSDREVNQDVARVQRQIEQIRRSRRPRPG